MVTGCGCSKVSYSELKARACACRGSAGVDEWQPQSEATWRQPDDEGREWEYFHLDCPFRSLEDRHGEQIYAGQVCRLVMYDGLSRNALPHVRLDDTHQAGEVYPGAS